MPTKSPARLSYSPKERKSFALLPTGKISYSPMERKLFAQLVHNKRPLTSTVLMERYYQDEAPEHFHARETINSALTSLRKKLDFNKAPIKLRNSELSGPKPKRWWLEKRK